MASQLIKIRIGVFGDSISEGIGSKRLNYCKPLEEKMRAFGVQAEIINFSCTGTTIRYIETIKDKFVKDKFDYIVIAYGNVDAMLRPDTNSRINFYSHIPKRYKKTGMLNPRPYFSDKWYKSVMQHADSWLRCSLNRVLLRLQGGAAWVKPDESETVYQDALALFQSCSKHIIMLTTVRVSDKLFPGTNDMYRQYNKIIERLADAHGCEFVDLYSCLSDDSWYYEDIFHPNEAGYFFIADLIFRHIISTQIREST